MHLLALLIPLLLMSCSSGDTQKPQKEATPPPPPKSPAAIKQNVTLMSSVVTQLQLLDAQDYLVSIQLSTAIPIRNSESIAEPGQSIIVRPEFVRDEHGEIILTNEKNKRLLEVRSLKSGDFLFGKITLMQDGSWRLLDNGLK